MNFVVKNKHWDKSLEKILFGDEPICYLHIDAFDLFDIMVGMGLFPSKGQARKSPFGALGKQPLGFNNLTVGKKAVTLTTWIPIATMTPL